MRKTHTTFRNMFPCSENIKTLMKHIKLRRKKKRGDWGGVHRGCNFFSDVLFPVLEGGYVGVCYISL